MSLATKTRGFPRSAILISFKLFVHLLRALSPKLGRGKKNKFVFRYRESNPELRGSSDLKARYVNRYTISDLFVFETFQVSSRSLDEIRWKGTVRNTSPFLCVYEVIQFYVINMYIVLLPFRQRHLRTPTRRESTPESG